MDLKFALRSLWRTPAFTFLSVLILALGVGANTAIFSVIHAVVLRPLGYRNPDQLVSVSMTWPDGERFGQVSGPDFLDFESQNNAFKSMAAYGNEIVSVVANGKSEFVGMAAVSKDFLQTLAVVPVAGRAFVPADFDRKPAAATVSAGFWERHFGDVPFSRGHILKTAGVQLEIIGLLPPGFHFPESAKLRFGRPCSRF
jgi:putative ABC transport system permease protein